MKYSMMMSNLFECERAKPAFMSISFVSSSGSSKAIAKASAVGFDGCTTINTEGNIRRSHRISAGKNNV